MLQKRSPPLFVWSPAAQIQVAFHNVIQMSIDFPDISIPPLDGRRGFDILIGKTFFYLPGGVSPDDFKEAHPTEFAAITAPSPIVTPDTITASIPIRTSCPTTVSPFNGSSFRAGVCLSQPWPKILKGYVEPSIRWLAPFIINRTPGAIEQNLPMIKRSPL
ncbi:hypothetical protein ABD67_22055 [Bacillus sonorensis]|nr:hypothetical protein [Bacillus sonorensis]